MQFKTTTTYVVSIHAWLDQIISEIPTNAFFNKGRCGIGGTTLEINNPKRCSIIVVPTKGILHDKKTKHPDLFVIDGDVKWEEVAEELGKKQPAQKIMTTPESMWKIITAAESVGMIDELYQTCFLLLDECHTFASEGYRENILRPFDYFWSFEHKSIISATPYYFSDPRFYDLDYYEVQFDQTLGTIHLIESADVYAALDDLISNLTARGKRSHSFLNSVSGHRIAIEKLRITDASVYCANDKDGENMKKLGQYATFYQEQPGIENFKAVNFYTCKYYEGWDMHDENAVIIIVTDIRNEHSLGSPSMKLKQAAGRWRRPEGNSAPLEIYHITNHRNMTTKTKSFDTLKADFLTDADILLQQHDALTAYCKHNNRSIAPHQELERYADIIKETGEVAINSHKVDQRIYETISLDAYNHIDLIKEEWEKAGFDVKLSASTRRMESARTIRRKSKADQLEDDYMFLLGELKKEEITYGFGRTRRDQIMKSNPLAYRAAQLIDEETMRELKFKKKEVALAVIKASNARAEYKLLQMLTEEFKRGFYSNAQIVERLKTLYNMVDWRDEKTDEVKKACATDLDKNGWFDVEYDKKGGKHGYNIIRPRFTLTTVKSV